MFDGLFAALRKRLGTKDAQTASTPALRPVARNPRQPPAMPASTRWHAVSIKPGTKACEAALKAEGLRFLAKDAPRLPLADCDSSACACRYRHHDDRRDAEMMDMEPKDLLSRPMRRDTD